MTTRRAFLGGMAAILAAGFARNQVSAAVREIVPPLLPAEPVAIPAHPLFTGEIGTWNGIRIIKHDFTLALPTPKRTRPAHEQAQLTMKDLDAMCESPEEAPAPLFFLVHTNETEWWKQQVTNEGSPSWEQLQRTSKP